MPIVAPHRPSATETPGTATFRMTVEVDETGDALTSTGDLDVRGPDGSPLLTLSIFVALGFGPGPRPC